MPADVSVITQPCGFAAGEVWFRAAQQSVAPRAPPVTTTEDVLSREPNRARLCPDAGDGVGEDTPWMPAAFWDATVPVGLSRRSTSRHAEQPCRRDVGPLEREQRPMLAGRRPGTTRTVLPPAHRSDRLGGEQEQLAARGCPAPGNGHRPSGRQGWNTAGPPSVRAERRPQRHQVQISCISRPGRAVVCSAV